jgi:D-tagatose-1,6-bisphosphate aldolase subunit GatZ/KbaZ
VRRCGLAEVEDNWIEPKHKSYFKQRVLQVMRDEPLHWKKYYIDEKAISFDLQFSLSDRIRYYWSQPDIVNAQKKLFDNLDKNLPPLALISQAMPLQYQAIRAGQLRYTMRDLVMHAIGLVINQYRVACGAETHL